MTARLTLHRPGPGQSVQDMGRPGLLARGLSRGGAADRLALIEGAALLGQSPDLAALELTGAGTGVEVTAPVVITLTGAPMRASVDGRALAWNASHRLQPGERLTLGAAKRGVWSYLSVAGGIDTALLLGSRAAHLVQDIVGPVGDGDDLPVGGGSPEANRTLPADARFDGGEIRILPSAHTDLFGQDMRDRFEATQFTRDARGNRQGVRLAYEGDPFATDGQLALVSDIIVPGDIQMTGDGVPYVLGPECQTSGGYPRIGAVIPADLPKALQAAPGTALTFRFVTRDEAMETHESAAATLKRLTDAVTPLIRDPSDIADLAGYQLIGGVTAGRELTGEE